MRERTRCCASLPRPEAVAEHHGRGAGRVADSWSSEVTGELERPGREAVAGHLVAVSAFSRADALAASATVIPPVVGLGQRVIQFNSFLRRILRL